MGVHWSRCPQPFSCAKGRGAGAGAGRGERHVMRGGGRSGEEAAAAEPRRGAGICFKASRAAGAVQGHEPLQRQQEQEQRPGPARVSPAGRPRCPAARSRPSRSARWARTGWRRARRTRASARWPACAGTAAAARPRRPPPAAPRAAAASTSTRWARASAGSRRPR